MRKRMFVLVGVSVLVMGLLAGTVLAQEPDEADGKATLFVRVAEILGLPEDDVKNAFDQAKTELRHERTDAKIDGLIEKGDFTDEEAGELREKFEAMNEKLDGFDGFGKRSFGRRGLRFGPHDFGDGEGRSFRFESRSGGGAPPDFEGMFPDFEEMKKHHDSLEDRERFHYFKGPHFKFFFGPDVEAEGVTEENAPGDPSSL